METFELWRFELWGLNCNSYFVLFTDHFTDHANRRKGFRKKIFQFT